MNFLCNLRNRIRQKKILWGIISGVFLLQLFCSVLPKFVPDFVNNTVVESLMHNIYLPQTFLFWNNKIFSIFAYLGNVFIAALGLLLLLAYKEKCPAAVPDSIPGKPITKPSSGMNWLFLLACVFLFGALCWYGYVFFISKPLVINSWYGYPETLLVENSKTGERKKVSIHELNSKYNFSGGNMYSPERDMGKNPKVPKALVSVSAQKQQEKRLEILPFAAGKYSDLPYPDLQWFLISPKEEAEIIRYFDREKPGYVFVDTDVERNFEYDRPSLLSDKRVLSEYLYRVERLNLLKDLWHKLKINYELKEKTPMLSV